MKKTVIFVIYLLSLTLLFGCAAAEQSPGKTVDFTNGLSEADVWIIPETEANRKTTVWGTATASGVNSSESRAVPLCEPGGNGLYLFRMIDSDGWFYSANSVNLKEGWSLQIKGSDPEAITLEVSDENGAVQNTYNVFAARL